MSWKRSERHIAFRQRSYRWIDRLLSKAMDWHKVTSLDWSALGGAFTVIAIVLGWVTGLWRSLYAKASAWARPPALVPRETMRIVPSGFGSRWSMGTCMDQPCMFAVACLNVTNITSRNAIIVRAKATTKNVDGILLDETIPPWQTARVTAHFMIQPVVRAVGSSLVTGIILTDQFGNEHKTAPLSIQSDGIHSGKNLKRI
jgi:hypothetical protein